MKVMVQCPTCGGRGSVLRTLLGKVGRNHPETSRRTAKSPINRIKWGTQRHNTLLALAEYGPMTAAEVADCIGVARNQTATRLQECRESGWVAYSVDHAGNRIERKTSEDAWGLVQEITEAGRVALGNLRDQHCS